MRKLFTLHFLLVLLFSSITSFAQTTYYVSTSGSDSNNGKSQASPWKSINKVNKFSFKPGDKILFKRGNRWYEELNPSSSGKKGNLIVFSSYGQGELPIISPTKGDYAINIRIKSYIRIDGIKAIAPAKRSGIAIRGNSIGNEILNCIVEGKDGNSGIVYTGKLEGGISSSSIIRGNRVSGFFQCIYGHGGMKVKGIIENNIVSNAIDDGIVARYGDFKGLIIKNNKLSNWRDDGIDLYGGSNIVIENNVLSDLPKSGSIVAGNGIKAGGGNTKSENVIIRYNIVKNLNHPSSKLQAGITTNGGDKIKIYGNVVYDVKGEAIVVPSSSVDVEIYNNTAISLNKTAVYIGSTKGISLKNNILWGKSSDLNINSSSLIASNNLLIKGTNESRYKSKNDVKANPSQVFQNHSSDDYRLKENSLAIGAGTKISSFIEGILGVTVTGSPDIGAYQYEDNNSNITPPTVNLGNNLTISSNQAQLKIDANVSIDGSMRSYKWEKLQGGGLTINSSNYQSAILKDYSTGVYKIRLTIEDQYGNIAYDELQITVNEDNSDNTPPSENEFSNGLNYKYYEGSWSKIPDFDNLKSVKSGTISNISLNPKRRDDEFGFTFTGYVQIDNSGKYTFYTASDDGSKLYINDKLIVNNDGLHGRRERSGSISLDKGYHKIKVEFFERTGGEILEVKYQGPNLSKQALKSSKLYTNSEDTFSEDVSDPQPKNEVSNGLTYKYYEGYWNKMPDFNKLNVKKTGTINNFSLEPKESKERFAFVYEGFIQIDNDDTYTFYTTSDDGSKLYIDNKVVVNNDGVHAAIEKSGKIFLKSGLHPIKVSFFERSHGEVLEVKYSSNNLSKRTIPSNKLYIDDDVSEPNKGPGGETDTEMISGINYKYYHGDWTQIPDFKNLQSIKSGKLDKISLAPKSRDERFGFVYEGYFKAEKTDLFKFYTLSDDGSRLYINNKKIVENDGLHGPRERSGSVNLEKGYHSIKIEFFERTSGQRLDIMFSNSTNSKKMIPSSLLYVKKNQDNARALTADLKKTSSKQIINNEDIEDEFTDSHLNVFPVPFNQYIDITTNITEPKVCSFELYNVNGNLIYSELVTIKPEEKVFRLNTDEIKSAGAYILRVQIEGEYDKMIKVLKE